MMISPNNNNNNNKSGSNESIERMSHKGEMIPISKPSSTNSRKLGEIVRPKKCKEKDCKFVAFSSEEDWKHKFTVHRDMYPYVCSEQDCTFLTKYKHHMSHHLLSKHSNEKQFECRFCDYKCVSKSMLVSHAKSHWNFYQYNCGSCFYKSKFLNTYKKHLRDYNHKQGLVLNRFGLPDPSIVIDVHGTRRGPRQASKATSCRQNRTFSERSQAFANSVNPTNAIQSCSSNTLLGRLQLQITNFFQQLCNRNIDIDELQRQIAINPANRINCSNIFDSNAAQFIPEVSVCDTESKTSIQNFSAALPQLEKIESTDAPLDLRVSAVARKN